MCGFIIHFKEKRLRQLVLKSVAAVDGLSTERADLCADKMCLQKEPWWYHGTVMLSAECHDSLI